MPTLTRSHALGNRLHVVQAQGRVADALLAVALDVLEPYASDYLSPDDFDRLCELVREPVGTATDSALTTLLSELALVVLEADPELISRLEGIRRRSP